MMSAKTMTYITAIYSGKIREATRIVYPAYLRPEYSLPTLAKAHGLAIDDSHLLASPKKPFLNFLEICVPLTIDLVSRKTGPVL
jgi:hypothetical protein